MYQTNLCVCIIILCTMIVLWKWYGPTYRFKKWIKTPPQGSATKRALKGYVVFFDSKKGFGFLHGADGGEYYFSKSAIYNNFELESGQFVYFFVKENINKRAEAISVRFDQSRMNRRHYSVKNNARKYTLCLSCGHKITPRWRRGTPYCPFCGNDVIPESEIRYVKL